MKRAHNFKSSQHHNVTCIFVWRATTAFQVAYLGLVLECLVMMLAYWEGPLVQVLMREEVIIFQGPDLEHRKFTSSKEENAIIFIHCNPFKGRINLCRKLGNSWVSERKVFSENCNPRSWNAITRFNWIEGFSMFEEDCRWLLFFWRNLHLRTKGHSSFRVLGQHCKHALCFLIIYYGWKVAAWVAIIVRTQSPQMTAASVYTFQRGVR